MTISAGKRAARRAFKREQKFELNPPRCGSCVHFIPDNLEVINGIKVYREPYCGLGDINVFPRSLCDAWRDRKTHDTLEKT